MNESEKIPDYLNVTDDEESQSDKDINHSNKSIRSRSRSENKKKNKNKKSKHYHNAHHYHHHKHHHNHNHHNRKYSDSISPKKKYNNPKEKSKYKEKEYTTTNKDTIINNNDISSSPSQENYDPPQKKPKWSSPRKNLLSDIKTIKISNGGKKIEVISNQNSNSTETKLKKDLLKEKPTIKEKPNFNPSGLLAKQTNTKNGVVLKYTIPQDRAFPQSDWRIYQFKHNDKEPQFIFKLNNSDNFLIGKDIAIASIILTNNCSSRQHAVIQFRKKISQNDDSKIITEVAPYIIDLESTNGTFLNKEKIDASRYYELKHEDLLHFGDNSVDYVIMLCK